MNGIACPLCGGKGLKIVWGMLTAEAFQKFEADPDVVLGGCCIELGVTHECADCQHRWGLGELGHHRSLDWLYQCEVNVDYLVHNLDARFCPTQPKEPLMCPDQRSPFDGEQVVLGSPALVVLSQRDDRTVEVAEYGAITASPGFYVPIRVRPVLLFSDDNRSRAQRADHLARVIKDASRRRRATFRPCDSCGRKVPPEWRVDDGHCIRCATNTDTGKLEPTTDEHPPPPHDAPEGPLFVMGEVHGRRVLSAEEWPEEDTIVWLESQPDRRMYLVDFDESYEEGEVGWYAEPEPYERSGDEAAQ